MQCNLDNMSSWHADEREWWDKYGEYMTFQWQLTPKLHNHLREGLENDYKEYLFKPKGKLLDIGCGSGWLSLSFAERGMSVIGIDVSQEQINAANEIKKRKCKTNLQFECADFIDWYNLKYLSYFDSVFVSAFMHHLPKAELEQIIAKIASVLKPGGKVFMYEPLSSTKKRRLTIKLFDYLINNLQQILLLKVPNWFNLFSERHLSELARGYTMASPHERPVNIKEVEEICDDSFIILKVDGWHIYSLGFSMQITSLKQKARRFYEPISYILYRVDKFIIQRIGWEAFSTPNRFILCSVKMIRK